jgi:hypothetical protein
MVPGFNTDFKYRGETYHVQTEDLGTGNPFVVTLLYHKGAILASRRTSYRDLAGKPGFERELLGLMRAQHKDVMRALLAGDYDRDGSAPAAAGGKGEHPAVAAAVTASTPTAQPHREQAARNAAAVATAPSPAIEPPPGETSLDKAATDCLGESSAETAAPHGRGADTRCSGPAAR